ncbi:MAG: hypothetical protein K9J84_09860 [Bacteroidia bacterium]|nr:hypothetical protein [Bacteroidia bacterium]
MCFSASASFGAGAVLTVIGIASIKKAHHSSQILFASIPLIFGIQQLSEGILWLVLPYPEYHLTQKIATYIFLFFAQILWLIWVPISFLYLEKSKDRKLLQKGFVGLGLLVGLSLAYCLITFNVQAIIMGHHIRYVQDYPASLKDLGVLLYAIATIVPPFFAHLKRIWLFSIAIFISYIILAIFYQHYVLSVWCFFASIISFSIYFILQENPKAQETKLLAK